MTIFFAANETDAFQTIDNPASVTKGVNATHFDSDFTDGSMLLQGSARLAHQFSSSFQSTIWFHFVLAKETQNTNQDQNQFISIGDKATSDGSNQPSFWLDCDNGDIQFRYNDGSWTNVGAPFAWAADTPLTIDVEIIAHASAGEINVWINGVLERSVTGVDTIYIQSGSDFVQFFSQRYTASDVDAEMSISEIIIADVSTIGMRVATVSPSAAGTTGDWTGAYTDVDDSVVDDDTTTELSSLTANQVSTFAASNLSVAAAAMDVVALVECCRGKNSGAAPDNIQHALRTGGADYYSASIPTLSAAYSGSVNVRATNPDTVGAWTTTEIDALEIGVKAIT